MKKPAEILLLAAVLFVSTGFVLGLTYLPCYSSLCSEEFLPYETRLHIATFYAILASTACALLLRATNARVRRISKHRLVRREVPILKKRISVGGLALSIWLVGLILATTAFWIDPEMDFWQSRTEVVGWAEAKVRLVVTAIIGHHADMLLGLVIIPVSRNSILGRVFDLHQSTLLYAHKLIAYLLIVAAFAHGAAYYTFVGLFAHGNDAQKLQINIDNPTLTTKESQARGYYYYTNLASGMLSFIAMLIIGVTALPILRRQSYQTFYYCHIIFSIFIFIALSIHASTDFYFMLPGLLLWVTDWAWRLIRGETGLRRKVSGTLENAGAGWYKITLPLAVVKSNSKPGKNSDPEKHAAVVDYPIQWYYLNIPSVSRLQTHAYTAAMVRSPSSGPVFLLQRSQGKKPANLEKEWTHKLAGVLPEPGARAELDVRVEGPYLAADGGFATASRIVCVVGGTGVTGALSLAQWWLAHRAGEAASTFALVWTVRHREMAEIREWTELVDRAGRLDNFAVQMHVSSESGRLDVRGALTIHLGMTERGCTTSTLCTGNNTPLSPERRQGWVYMSGPDGLLSATEDACLDLQQEIRQVRKTTTVATPVQTLDWYVAKWEV